MINLGEIGPRSHPSLLDLTLLGPKKNSKQDPSALLSLPLVGTLRAQFPGTTILEESDLAKIPRRLGTKKMFISL